jgi:hypothetical protein
VQDSISAPHSASATGVDHVTVENTAVRDRYTYYDWLNSVAAYRPRLTSLLIAQVARPAVQLVRLAVYGVGPITRAARRFSEAEARSVDSCRVDFLSDPFYFLDYRGADELLSRHIRARLGVPRLIRTMNSVLAEVARWEPGTEDAVLPALDHRLPEKRLAELEYRGAPVVAGLLRLCGMPMKS